jgi:hypothetical protein
VPTSEAGLYELDFLPWDATNLGGLRGKTTQTRVKIWSNVSGSLGSNVQAVILQTYETL